MIPNLFSKEPLPGKLPHDMALTIRRLREKHHSKEEFLRACFDFLRKRYHLRRLQVLAQFFNLFRKDIGWMWHKKGHLHCTSVNYVLRAMLVRSGLFADDEIILRLTTTWYIIPHQYLTVLVGDSRQVDVDVSTYDFGIPFGAHAGGWHCGSFFPGK